MVSVALANAAWYLAGVPARIAFESALADPEAEQERILLRYLRDNAGTAFGRTHGFADIRNADQYARRIPLRDYEDLRPWIDRIRAGESAVLTAEPVRRLVPTSGSTAARKLIPYTAGMQRELNRAVAPWITDLYGRRPRAMLGPSYWSISPAAQDSSHAGADDPVPVGFDDDTEYLGGWQRRLAAAVMAVPSGVCRIVDMRVWRYATLLSLLRREDLTLISVWHPSFLTLLLDSLPSEWTSLLDDVATGGCRHAAALPTSLRPAMHSAPNARRARRLAETGPDAAAALWPSLQVISSWSDANAAPAAETLRRRFPNVLIQPKGILATEGVVSIPYAGRHPLAVRSHFLEFLDDSGRIARVNGLRVGRTYDVVLTTAGGLYRYRLRDRIYVDGFVGGTPSVRFRGKSGLISDRAGEKLSEGFVADVLSALLAGHRSRPTFAMLAPEVDHLGCRYTLFADAAEAVSAEQLDELLSRNPQYDYCRRLGQLLPATVVRVPPDAYARYTRRLLDAGQRLGDIKAVALSALEGWRERLAVDG